jgi:carbon monoxide dehydrogenase subunit G
VKVKIDRTFPMPAPSAVTWATLADIPTVASCMPGAKITERIDDAHYKGTVTVKVGPATLAFKGEIEVQALDAVKRTIRLVAKGTDSSGSSAAALDLTAKVQDADAGRSELVGHSEASVSGKAATFGGRMMDAVSDQILKQFAANFAGRVEAQSSSGSEGGGGSAPTGSTEPAASRPTGSGEAVSAPSAASRADPAASLTAPVAAAAPKPALAPSAQTGSAVVPEAQPLNGLALAWAVFKAWIRGLFTNKAA